VDKRKPANHEPVSLLAGIRYMPKDNRIKQQHMRSRIAATAARIMAEDGIEDFALAKRKAARQLGTDATHALPDNSEVEDALRTHQALYQEAEQRERIRHLRRRALAAMEALSTWRPYLCGSVLKGTAGRYSAIDLQLFTDDGKSIELHFLNRDIRYEVSEQQREVGGQMRVITILRMDWDGCPLSLAIHPANDERVAMKASGTGRLLERAGIVRVRELLQADDQDLSSLLQPISEQGNGRWPHG